ncbi:MAG TPA: alpha/beta hydrolase [Myxococcota bacterium]|nr:alpha/beta hydrolase [Myxococcota bacterium]
MAKALFIHSTGTFSSMWRPYLDAIARDATPLTPDNLGYPPNPPLPRGAAHTTRDDAQHLLGQLAVHGATEEPVDLYGHSYGGLVALRLVELLGLLEHGGRVRSLWLFEPVLFGSLPTLRPGSEAAERTLAMVESGGFFDDELGGTEVWLERFIDYWNRPGSWRRMPDAMRDPIRAVGWKMYQEVRQGFFDLTATADRPIPTLPAHTTILMGERSPLEARAMCELLAEHSPDARLVDLPGVGHMAPLTHPEPVRQALLAHAERLSAGAVGLSR